MFMSSTIGICFIPCGYCINCLFVWSMFLCSVERQLRLRGDPLLFENIVKMYKIMKIMTIVEGELLREMKCPCMHQIYSVVFSTVGLLYFLKEFIDGDDISVFILLVAITVISMASVIENYSICFVAKVALDSKKWIRQMGRTHGWWNIRRKFWIRC